METHVKAVAFINIGFGILGFFVGGLLFFIVAISGLISGDPTAITITTIVGAVLCGFFFILSIPEVIAGLGLLKYKSWARILTVIIAVIDLFNIPIGTAFGIYALWVLMNEETEKLFKSSAG